MEFDREMRLATPTGADLRLLATDARRRPRAVVQINHGLDEHAGRYAPFAAFLAEAGFHVVAHDHRGHGRTRAPGAPLGHFGPGTGMAEVLADVGAVHDHLAARHAGLPVLVFGHSMGGMIAFVFALRHADRIAGAAIWNAPFATRLEARAGKAVLAWERFRRGSDVPSPLLSRLTFAAWRRAFPDRRTDSDWLSRDAEAVDRYIADPLCGREPSIGVWNALFDLSLAAAGPKALRVLPRAMPLQLVGGGNDPATGNGKAVRALEKRLSRLGFSDLETRIYRDMRHETLNEIGHERAMRDFRAWAERAAG